MSTVISHSGTASAVPTSYDTTNYSYYNVSNISNGYTASSSSTYATIYLTRGYSAETYIHYKFDLSSIPEGATINSITCTAKGYASNVTARYVALAQLQMFTGTTAKGSATSLTTSATEYTLTPGTWTRDELQDARVRIYAQRGSSSTSSTIYLYFYGASISVTYTYYETQYTVTVSNYGSVSVTPASQSITSGSSATLQATSVSGLTILDNDVDVTSRFTLNSGVYKYTISNISADHTIVVTKAMYFKNGSTWTRATKVWKKVNGSWVRQYSMDALVETSVVAPYMEFPFCNNSLTENQLILSDYKKIVKGN